MAELYKLYTWILPFTMITALSLKGYRGCIQKFPDLVYNEVYAYKSKHSLRSNAKGYGGKTH